MSVAGERSPEQREREGRLAWIIVGCCAAVTVMLIVVIAYALSGSVAQMIGSDVRPVAGQHTETSASVPTHAPRVDGPSYDAAVASSPAGGGQVQKRSAPVREVPPPPRAGGADLGEVRKQGSTAENEAVKSHDSDNAPTTSQGRETPRTPSEPEDPRHAARRI